MHNINYRIKQGFRLPTLEFTLTRIANRRSYAFDLTGATNVTASVKGPDGVLVFEDRVCTITDADAGQGVLEWDADDTTLSGLHHVEFVVNYPNGTSLPFPLRGGMPFMVEPAF